MRFYFKWFSSHIYNTAFVLIHERIETESIGANGIAVRTLAIHRPIKKRLPTRSYTHRNHLLFMVGRGCLHNARKHNKIAVYFKLETHVEFQPKTQERKRKKKTTRILIKYVIFFLKLVHGELFN